MSQTYTRLLYHLVFSTKERRPLIAPKLQPELHPYMGGITKRLGGIPMSIGGIEDHVHLLLSIPPTIAVSDFMRDLKAGSSKWMRADQRAGADFEWQRGYSAFSVNQSIVADVDAYIRRQEEHHRKRSFVEELKHMLEWCLTHASLTRSPALRARIVGKLTSSESPRALCSHRFPN